MSVRKAWFKMVEEYEKRRDRKGSRIAYEEMSYTMHEIQGGVTEGNAMNGLAAGAVCRRIEGLAHFVTESAERGQGDE